jgi:hypothetical protein
VKSKVRVEISAKDNEVCREYVVNFDTEMPSGSFSSGIISQD